MHWLQRAVAGGSSEAAEKIASLYDRGLGVPVNKPEAMRWIERSADMGYLPAIYELGRAYEQG